MAESKYLDLHCSSVISAIEHHSLRTNMETHTMEGGLAPRKLAYLEPVPIFLLSGRVVFVPGGRIRTAAADHTMRNTYNVSFKPILCSS